MPSRKGERMDEYLSKKNSEGYSDPTAHKAVIRADRYDYRPVVYICSPFSGDTEENMEKARDYCRYAVDKGVIPLAPHLLLPQYMDEGTERDLALFMDLVLLTKCKEVWVFGGIISSAMEAEIKRAKWKNYRLRYFNESCEEVHE